MPDVMATKRGLSLIKYLGKRGGEGKRAALCSSMRERNLNPRTFERAPLKDERWGRQAASDGCRDTAQPLRKGNELLDGQ